MAAGAGRGNGAAGAGGGADAVDGGNAEAIAAKNRWA